MASLQDTLKKAQEAKKPFKKKPYRSYLDLDFPQNSTSPSKAAPSKLETTSTSENEATSEIKVALENEPTLKIEAASKFKSTLKAEVISEIAEGYARIPHQALELLYNGGFSQNEYRLIIFLMRMTYGWHRQWLLASVNEILEAMNWKSDKFWNALTSLRDQGYILVLQKAETLNLDAYILVRNPGNKTSKLRNAYALNSKLFGLTVKTKATSENKVASVLGSEVALKTEVGTSFENRSRLDDSTTRNNYEISNLNILFKETLKKPLSLEEIFESYFSEIRAPIAAKQEREAFLEIRERNPDLTDAEFLECFELISKDRDSKGNPISFKFVWMAKGLDKLLKRARGSIQDKTRKAIDKAQADEEVRLKIELETQQASQETSMTQEEIANTISQILGSFGKRIETRIASNEMTQEELQKRREFLKEQARLLNTQKSEVEA